MPPRDLIPAGARQPVSGSSGRHRKCCRDSAPAGADKCRKMPFEFQAGGRLLLRQSPAAHRICPLLPARRTGNRRQAYTGAGNRGTIPRQTKFSRKTCVIRFPSAVRSGQKPDENIPHGIRPDVARRSSRKRRTHLPGHRTVFTLYTFVITIVARFFVDCKSFGQSLPRINAI